MTGNSVFGLEMSVMPRRGIWAGDGTMPLDMQNLFFSTASHLLAHDDALAGVGDDDKGVVFMPVAIADRKEKVEQYVKAFPGSN